VIAALLDAVRGRGAAGDALLHRVERTEVAIETGRVKSAGASEGTGLNLRVLHAGRAGVAGTTATDALDGLVDRALASAALAEAVAIELPRQAPVPAVATFDRPAADASLDALIALGQEVAARLARDGCQVNVVVERAVTATQFGNTAGAHGDYPSTAVTVTADVRRIATDDVLMVYDYYSAAPLPGAADVDMLVRGVTTRLDLATRTVAAPEGSLPVVVTPDALGAILLPLEQALSGKSVVQGVSPLGGRIGEQAFDARWSLTDDPLAPGRPHSRPFDDEGTPSSRRPLIERGVVRAFIYDLETAARAGAASTGHGHRGTFGKPHVGYTNLVVGPLPQSPSSPLPLPPSPHTRRGGTQGELGGGLIAGVRDGLLVDELIGVGQGNVISGAFSHPVALAYRIQNGAITGRVKDAAVAGNVYELLQRIGGWGDDGRWSGSRWAPSLLLEGVVVTG
jgi:PmbA protein